MGAAVDIAAMLVLVDTELGSVQPEVDEHIVPARKVGVVENDRVAVIGLEDIAAAVEQSR